MPRPIKITTPEQILEHVIDDRLGDYRTSDNIWLIPRQPNPAPEVLFSGVETFRQKFKLTHTIRGGERQLEEGSAGLCDISSLKVSARGLQIACLDLYEKVEADFAFIAEKGTSLSPMEVAAHGIYRYLYGLDSEIDSDKALAILAGERTMQKNELSVARDFILNISGDASNATTQSVDLELALQRHNYPQR